ncbi:kinase-like protein [Cubamyces sp. BRFM 1775]|nr:kinase-like protein [Cubamyces sp. BRFM 1775]
MAASTAFPDFTGCIVEPYQLIERISSGKHNVIYRAIDTTAPSSSAGPNLRDDYAVKVIPKVGPTRGKLEIDLHRIVSAHPNVASVVDAFETEDHYFLVLELYPGGDLRTKIWDERVYHHNDALIRTAFLQIVDAVEACHAANVYHRDLCPENILCNEDGSEVYLCDFGSGSSRPTSNQFGSGTLDYTSPECLGEDLGHNPYSSSRHDIWALGIILFNMITMSHPWAKPSTDDDQFSDYLHNPDHFLEKFNISEGASVILRAILMLNPMGRISLPNLRAAILKLDTFFSPEKPTNHQSDEPQDIGCLAPSLSIHIGAPSGDDEDVYVFSSADPFCLPAKPFHLPLELNYKTIDAIVRLFDADADIDEELFSASPSPSFSMDDDMECCSVYDEDDSDDDDDDGPITPEAIVPAEVNVYEGRFMEELRGLAPALPKETDTKSSSPPSLLPFGGLYSGLETNDPEAVMVY